MVSVNSLGKCDYINCALKEHIRHLLWEIFLQPEEYTSFEDCAKQGIGDF